MSKLGANNMKDTALVVPDWQTIIWKNTRNYLYHLILFKSRPLHSLSLARSFARSYIHSILSSHIPHSFTHSHAFTTCASEEVKRLSAYTNTNRTCILPFISTSYTYILTVNFRSYITANEWEANGRIWTETYIY